MVQMHAAARTGGCQCGKVRYRLRASGNRVYACHCRECQKQSASAFGLSLPVRRSDLEIEGALSVHERSADSGSTTRCHFCRACGTRIFHKDATSELCSLKAGSLDAPDDLVLVAHIWTSRKQPWLMLDPELPAFETQPEDLADWRCVVFGADGQAAVVSGADIPQTAEER